MYINFQNFSKNVHLLYIQRRRLFKKNVHNWLHLMYTIFQRMNPIMYIQNTQNFKECTLFCSFNEHNFSKNIHSYVHLMYFSKNLHNLYVHCTQFFLIEYAQFCTFNVHSFSKNVCNYVHSIYTIVYIQCTQNFQKNIHIFFTFNIKA